MIFDPNSTEYQKFCKSVGISPATMHQVANNELFKAINKLMENMHNHDVLEAAIEPNFDEMSVDELKAYIKDNGGTFHHMAGKDKLVEVAKEI